MEFSSSFRASLRSFCIFIVKAVKHRPSGTEPDSPETICRIYRADSHRFVLLWHSSSPGRMQTQKRDSLRYPTNGVCFAACETGHNRLKVTAYVYKITGFLHSRTVQAISSTCFADNHYWWIFFIFMCEVTNDSACKRTNTCLDNTCVGRSIPASLSCWSASITIVPYPCMTMTGFLHIRPRQYPER